VLIWLCPGQHLVCYPVRGGELLSFVAAIRTEPWSGESWTEPGDPAEVVAAYAGWHPEVKEVLSAAGVVTRWALHDRPGLTRWCTDRVAVVGDAAHAMLPFGAQGANQAIEAAFALAACLSQGPDVPSALRRYEQIRLPRLLRARPVALLHSLGYTAPIGIDVPGVVTVHDLNFMRHVEMGSVRRLALRAVVGMAARRAARIVTISSFSRREIVSALRIPEGRVVVTPLAAEPMDSPSAAHVREVRERHRLPGSYLIAFGSTARHKNIDGLVRAFEAVAADLPHDLVVAGHLPDGALAALAPSLATRVRRTGYVDAADLAALISGSDGLVFPSRYEGFGIPLLNAQALGVPVAASRAAALPEVGGPAVLYFDPDSTREMAEALRALVQPGREREDRVRAGRANATRYDWLQTARATLAVYRAALGVRARPLHGAPA